MDNALKTKVPSVSRELQLAGKKQAKRDERALSNQGYEATTGGQYITQRYHPLITNAVIEKLTGRSYGLSADMALERIIRQLRPEIVALACLQGALHSISKQETFRDTCINMGQLLHMECFRNNLLKHDKKAAEKIFDTVSKRHGNVRVRQTAAKKLAGDIGFSQRTWSRLLCCRAGAWMIERLLEATPEVFCIVDARNSEYQLTLTAAGVSMIEEIVAEAVLNNPVFQPFTTAPTPWTKFHKRGSDDPRIVKEVPLLRTFHKDIVSAANHAIRTGTMQPALDAISALQAVPFTINTWLLDLIRECDRKAIAAPGLPMKDPLPIERVRPDVWKHMDEEQKTLHRKEVGTKRKINRSRVGETVCFEVDMATAGIMASHEAFYVPQNCDWRGRVYGVTFFNFSREDRVRSLFLFANGAPIGEEGITWLKVHVANTGAFEGIDKAPMEDRIAWVDAHLEEIVAMLAWPTGRAHQWWRDADSPFLFLAACKELTAALVTGPTYLTHLPVSWDGACNGLQHMAAMTRAPEGRYVNLTDNAIPEDVYSKTADAAKVLIDADLVNFIEEGEEKDIKQADEYRKLAKLVLDFGVDRKLFKRNTMTFFYSSGAYGMAKQHLEDLMEPLKLDVLKGKIQEHPFGDDDTQYAAAKYLGKRGYAAVKSAAPLPAEAMGFMQELARLLAHEGKPLRWVSPAGIPWINRYHEPTTERINLWLTDAGVKRRLQVVAATGSHAEIDKERAANGVAPNFVHACDASHLLLTVNACVAEGITNIATVHDSYGCLASQAGRFNQIIREQFLKMYEDHDVLAELLESARADLTPASHHKLPALPEKGTLDIKEILNARYAFA